MLASRRRSPRSQGHKVYAPSLTGLADRSHLLTRDVNPTTHANDVANLIKWEDLKDGVLVGHSSAGFVITQAAEEVGAQVASIVYLDAFVPQVGDSLISLANPGPRKALEDAVARGDLVAKPVPAAVFNVNEKDRAWWSGFDIRYPLRRESAKRMSNPKLHQNLIFASGPLILTFAKVAAEKGCECWNRTTRVLYVPPAVYHGSCCGHGSGRGATMRGMVLGTGSGTAFGGASGCPFSVAASDFG